MRISNRAHGTGVAPVDAWFACQYLTAHDAGLDVKQQALDFGAVELDRLRRQPNRDCCVGFTRRLGAGLFVPNLVGRTQFVFGQGVDLCDQGFVFGGGCQSQAGLPASRTNSWIALIATLLCS